MQLFQKLFRKPQAMPAHELAVVDFDHGGCITIATRHRRLDLPRKRRDIRLHDTLLSHEPYAHCGGNVIYRRRFGWLICEYCGQLWLRPLEATTLGSLLQHFHDAGFACIWKW